MRKALALLLLVGLLGVLAACGSDDDEGEPEAAAPTEAADTGAAEETDACATDQLNLVSDGTLTIGTDNPAFPPWFQDAEGAPWDPTTEPTKMGYEAAVAYAVAGELGFSDDAVKWVVVPFDNVFRPGPKDFDFDINQTSYLPARDQAVDFSDSYYDVEQAVVTLGDSDFAGATSLADLKGAKLGAQVGTTSLNAINDVIQPDAEPNVYSTNNDAVSALQNGQIDGLVVDYPTSLFVTAVQVENGKVVGRLPAEGQEYFGLVFEEGNPLRDCVNEALAALRDAGMLDDSPRSGSKARLLRSSNSLVIAGGRSDRRSTLIAAASTVVFAVLAVLLVTNAPGWPAVKEAFFNKEVFRESLEVIPEAFLLNIKIFLIAEALILVVALGIAILRGLPGPVFFPLRALAVVYADFFRGVPTILVIYILGFGAPALQISGVPTDPLFWGITALVLVYSAYVSEVYRAGIESVHPSQEAAARSLGLSRAKALRFVVLPQAVRRVMPPLLNDFIGLQKDTALVALLGPVEAFRQSQIEVAATFNYTPYLVTALLFVALTVPMARLTDWLVARDRRRQLAAGGAR